MFPITSSIQVDEIDFLSKEKLEQECKSFMLILTLTDDECGGCLFELEKNRCVSGNYALDRINCEVRFLCANVVS